MQQRSSKKRALKKEAEGNTKQSEQKGTKKSRALVSLETLLKENPSFQLVHVQGHGEKIRCTLTGHDLPKSSAELQRYMASKQYKRATEGWYKETIFEQYLPYIVPHKDDQKKLFCKVTKQILNKIPSQVEKHFKGRRFQKLKTEYDAKLEEEKLKKQKREDAKKVDKSSGFDVANFEADAMDEGEDVDNEVEEDEEDEDEEDISDEEDEDEEELSDEEE